MGTEESDKLGASFKFMEPKDETVNRSLQPHWTSSMQAYHNAGSTPIPFLNPHYGPYFGQFIWPKQSTISQYNFLHESMRISNNSAIAGVIPNQQQQPSAVPVVGPAGDAASVFSEKIQRMFGANNEDSIKKCNGSLQSKSSITKEAKEIKIICSTPNHDMSGASGGKEPSDEGHDSKHDFPSPKQKCNVVSENVNSRKQHKDTMAGLNASASVAKLAKLENDEIRKERKRLSNRESAKRSRLRKQKECEELRGNMDNLKDENSSLTHMLIRLSEECMDLSNENDSIQAELVKMYGAESIADLLPMKPS
ncbi:G-box-binding factor 1 isoform X2 [Arachis hypogaea]|uniref:BZIP domain-containing protein n=1 Tax=Arachis hypogaea TaxID=3818 RepID=A0A445B0R0_ARAHY|nr:G-box-binding factor 1 isoform X2 [Arachis hypogaea]QHO18019.1 G-box-binding factor [Arachis hypogaea]QHO18020.1 G-box-binding factor [Arachis hypogaea]QHO18021.1 G-box-binding factor [Arachis hypogaea]RYR32251.1 hypothetical protein Ahy_A10g046839 isoform A [Arachis hypogaea]RYR32252.1 hypothetical protein Ahy_A10g046839 isoform B [Arachis hypogaea]